MYYTGFKVVFSIRDIIQPMWTNTLDMFTVEIL